jgi:hypothetical protein
MSKFACLNGDLNWSNEEADGVVRAAKSLFGNRASVVAAWCALSARCEERTADYRFWSRIFHRLVEDEAESACETT